MKTQSHYGKAFALHALAAAVGLASGTSQASTIEVTNLNDSGPGSLRNAIETATDDGGVASFISFADGLSGTVRLQTALPPINDSLDINGGGITLRAAGPLEGGALLRFGSNGVQSHAVRGLTLIGGSDNSAIIAELEGDGSLLLQDAVITGSKGASGLYFYDADVVIERSEISGNSNMVGPQGLYGQGGGINAYGSDVLIRDSIIEKNTAGRDGGGIFAYDSSVELLRTVVSGNSAKSPTDSAGGGVAVRARFGDAELDVNFSSISGNSASRGAGVYLYGYDNASLEIRNSSITGNKARNGGGIFFDSSRYNSASVLIEKSVLEGNVAESNGGGADITTIDISIEDSRIAGNSANRFGGLSIRTDSAALVRSVISGNRAATVTALGLRPNNADQVDFGIDSTTIADHVASTGNAIEINLGYDGRLEITNSTISGNRARGVAMDVVAFSEYGDPDVVIENSTFSGNRSTSLAVPLQFRDTDLTVSHSTFVDNAAGEAQLAVTRRSNYNVSTLIERSIFTSSNDAEVRVGGNWESVYGSDEGGPVAGQIVNTIMTSNFIEGFGSEVTGLPFQSNPMLAPLAYRGGFTMVHEPMPGSPAINTGSEGARPDNRDQRGLSGNIAIDSDLGSVELVSNNPPRLVGNLVRPLSGKVGSEVPPVPVLDFFVDDDGDNVSVIGVEGLPPGLVYAGGNISGTLEVPGTFNVVVTVTDDDTAALQTIEQLVVKVNAGGGGGGGALPLGLLALFGFLARLRRRA